MNKTIEMKQSIITDRKFPPKKPSNLEFQMTPEEQDRVGVMRKENERLKGEIKAQNVMIKKLSDELTEQQDLMYQKESKKGDLDKIRAEWPTTIVIMNGSQYSMDNLRNLVGSIHQFRDADFLNVPQIMLYTHNLSPKDIEEIKYWFNVFQVPLASLFEAASTQSMSTTEISEDLLEAFLLVDGCRKYSSVLIVKPDTIFSNYNFTTLLREDFDKTGYFYFDGVFGSNSESAMFKKASDLVKRCSRLNCKTKDISSWKKEFETQSTNHGYFKDTQALSFYFCYLNIREDYLYSDILFKNTLESVSSVSATDENSSTKTKIGIGVPTTGKGLSNYSQSRILTSFLPSLLRSIRNDEFGKFEFIIYVAYDSYDNIWDNQDNLKKIKQEVWKLIYSKKTSIRVKFVKFSYSNAWLTFIWNKLFMFAMEDGCEYFYQVNDDLGFEQAGWVNYFVKTLYSKGGVGVAGPFDPRWNCTLLTQAFVSRKHWEIFGFMFPPEVL